MNAKAGPFLEGAGYLQLLARFHEVAKPETYFEIGTNLGASFRLAKCTKVAVDPAFKLKFDPVGASPAVHLFQTTSDDFFKNYDLRHFLTRGIDCAFLDGLHLFEFLLRDFMNAEKYAHAKSVFFVHDCYPINEEITEREWNTPARKILETRDWWAGDVWKLLPILREFRPDLEVQILDCPPTGLVVIRGMKPDSEILQKNYAAIIAKFGEITISDYGLKRLHAEFPALASKPLFAPEAFRSFFRLPAA